MNIFKMNKSLDSFDSISRHTWNFIHKYLCLRTIWPLKNFSNPIQVKLVSVLYSITFACYWNIEFILVSDSIIEARKQKEAISSFQRPLLNHKHSLWLPVTTVWTEVMNVGSAIEDLHLLKSTMNAQAFCFRSIEWAMWKKAQNEARNTISQMQSLQMHAIFFLLPKINEIHRSLHMYKNACEPSRYVMQF